jgi:outer membrane protein
MILVAGSRAFARLPAVFICVALLSAALPTSDVRAADEASLLTMAEAVGQALVRNDRMAGLRDNSEQANLSLRLARNTFRPKLVPNILGSFGQSDVSNQSYRLDLTQRFATGTELRATVGTGTARNQLGSFYNTDTTLAISQPLLRGFGRGVARRQLATAELRRVDAARQESLGEQQVAVDVARAYYQVVAQQGLADVAEKSLERSRRLLEASQAKLEAGKVSQLDVFRAQQLLTQAEGQILDTRAAVEDARDLLRYLMGRERDYDFQVVPDIPKAADPISAEEAVARALALRPELKSAEDAAVDADRGASYARNQILPQLDLNFALTRRETTDSFASSFRLDRFRFATFVAISMPVDRTPRTIEYHAALLERDRRRREIRTLRMRIADETRRAVRQQDRLVKGLEVADNSVGFAEKELEVAELRYQRGLSNNLDVVNAEANLLATQSRRISTLAELAVARLSLRATVGVLDPRKDFAGAQP